ncbi:MAG TPA: hypothetical protein VKB87_11925 [Myxococcaceae bacterium]|nr:hypothetical protein [Myxococcaceae bacterium]
MAEVQSTVVIGPQVLKIVRKERAPFLAAVVSTSKVTREIVEAVLAAEPSAEIVVNVPQRSMWTRAAIEKVQACGVAFGGIGDLMSAISRENVRDYQRSEYAFVERGLGQHDRVDRLDREADRLYVVHRNELPIVRVLLLNEYELTCEHVRTARSRYGAFDVILLTNPNGKPTQEAREVATHLGVGIFKWGQFLGRLNRK